MANTIPTSAYNQHCTGYQNPDNIGTGYILAPSLHVGSVPIKFSHPDSVILDEINAFDMAEARGVYLGQINVITVSSFCGPQGLIWGYDLVTHAALQHKSQLKITTLTNHQKNKVPVYEAAPLFEATQQLLGGRDGKHFPILPGSHVPCATKRIIKTGPSHLYCALAIGIPQNRKQQACLLMENVGEMGPIPHTAESIEQYRQHIKLDTAQSILLVGENQNINYQKIFVGISDIVITAGSIGCALVAAPYLCLAKKAIPTNYKTADALKSLSLNQWQQKVEKFYITA